MRRTVAEISKLPGETLLTEHEAADWARVSIWTVQRLRLQRRLRAVKYLNQWRTCKNWIDEYNRLNSNALTVIVTDADEKVS